MNTIYSCPLLEIGWKLKATTIFNGYKIKQCVDTNITCICEQDFWLEIEVANVLRVD